MKRCPQKREKRAAIWHRSGLGPFEWVISHRPFFRMMGVEVLPSIYTPKREVPVSRALRTLRLHLAYGFRDEMPF